MWLSETFAPGGRIGRVQYLLGHLVGLTIAMLAMALLAVVGVFFGAVGLSVIRTLCFAAGFIALFGGAIYVMVVLIVKRLHDLGMSGMHCIWIMALSFAASAAEGAGEAGASAFFSLCSLGVGLWLLFAPGVDHANEYGSQP